MRDTLNPVRERACATQQTEPASIVRCRPADYGKEADSSPPTLAAGGRSRGISLHNNRIHAFTTAFSFDHDPGGGRHRNPSFVGE